MSHLKTDVSTPQKQSAIALLMALLKFFKDMWGFFIPVLIGIFNSKANFNKILFTIGGTTLAFLLLRLNLVLSYFTTKFFVNEQLEFVYITGLFQRKKIIIAAHNIQSIQAQQHLLNRISNTYKIVIESAGSSAKEVELFAIHKNQLDALQYLLIDNNEETSSVNELVNADSEDYTMSLSSLLKLCISENHLQSFLIIVAFLYGKLNDVKDFIAVDATSWLDKNLTFIASGVGLIISFVMFCLLVAVGYSFVRIFINYYDFKISILKNNVVLNWGLINTKRKVISYNKIQTIEWSSNFIRQLLKLAICKIVALGDDITKKDAQITLPITQSDHINAIIQKFNPNLVFTEQYYLKIQKDYIFRSILLYGLPVFFIITIVALCTNKLFILLAFVWLLYYACTTFFFQKNYKLYINDYGLKVYKGVWGVQQQVITWENIQNLSIKTSPYQRKHSLSSICLLNAGQAIVIPYITNSQAMHIANFALYKIEIAK